MQRPQLIRYNANLPPGVNEDKAFTYQTHTLPYHFIAYPNAIAEESWKEIDKDPYAITDSEEEEEYEMNNDLIDNDHADEFEADSNDFVNIDHLEASADANSPNNKNQKTLTLTSETVTYSSTDCKIPLKENTVQDLGKKIASALNKDDIDSNKFICNSQIPCSYFDSNSYENDSDSDDKFFDNLKEDLNKKNRRMPSLSYEDGVLSDDENDPEDSEIEDDDTSEIDANNCFICEDTDL
jgi:hypothetical protein